MLAQIATIIGVDTLVNRPQNSERYATHPEYELRSARCFKKSLS